MAFDALLVLSFGGPDGPEDVLGFLENVTRGRGVPPERLAQVAEHYLARGGRSPINDCNRRLVADLSRVIDLPIYWGNRNWEPYVGDVVAQMSADGIRNAAVLTTSAYRSYSSCRQYREDLFAATDGVSIAITRLPHYCLHEGFVGPFVEGTKQALSAQPQAHVVFVTHSIPASMNQASGGPGVGAYLRQHEEVARRVAEGAGATSHSLAYCSRSGSPAVPWLEPDINDHLRVLRATGCTSVVVVPIGFVSDHMEVVHDLDQEARQSAEDLDMSFVRVPTPGTHPDFAAMVAGLVQAGAPAFCPVDCCRSPHSSLPVAS
jgi:ferrochelatase